MTGARGSMQTSRAAVREESPLRKIRATQEYRRHAVSSVRGEARRDGAARRDTTTLKAENFNLSFSCRDSSRVEYLGIEKLSIAARERERNLDDAFLRKT